MAYERRGNFSRGRNRSFGNRAPRKMYPAVCSKCGKDCEVPFKPDPEKGDVLCKECYKEKMGY